MNLKISGVNYFVDIHHGWAGAPAGKVHKQDGDDCDFSQAS